MAPRKPHRKNISPSRERYEKTHPVVSIRISRELRDELAEIKDSSGHSVADLLKIGTDRAKPDLDAAWFTGADFGYELG